MSFSSTEDFLSLFSHYVLFLIFLLFAMLFDNSKLVIVSFKVDILSLFLVLWRFSYIILFSNIIFVVLSEDTGNKYCAGMNKE